MMEQGKLLLVLVGVGSLFTGFVAAPYGHRWFGQMMTDMSNIGCNDSAGGMGGMIGSMSGHCRELDTDSENYSSTGSIVISNYSFNPKTVTVQIGTKVTWVNTDPVAHSVESGTPGTPTGSFQSTLLNYMQSFSYTFDTSGTFSYYCGPHPYMTGTIVVA